jgi:hypothetical protein
VTPNLADTLAEFAREECGAVRAEVRWVGLAEDRLPAPGADVVWSGAVCTPGAAIRLTVVENGLPVARYTVQPAIDLWVEARVTPSEIHPGGIFETVPGVVRLTDVHGTLAPAGRWQARGHLDAGAPVTAGAVQVPLDASAGDAVTLRVRRGGLTVTTTGTLLADARIGDRTAALSTSTKVRVDGVLTDPTTLDVGLGAD